MDKIADGVATTQIDIGDNGYCSGALSQYSKDEGRSYVVGLLSSSSQFVKAPSKSSSGEEHGRNSHDW